MIKESSKSITPQKSDVDTDDDDVFEGTEFASLTENSDEDSVKRDARRKIEIYWEKKRLKELFDDIDESELGF
jgi:hypothetical protein